MSLSQINKKLITIIVIVLAVFIVAIIAISIINKNRNLEFSTIERKMEAGAKKYLKNNPELLPSENGETIAISVTTLEDGKYIPTMSKMVKEDIICNGEVRVTNNGGYYVYFPYLNCGDKYVTKELYKKIIDPSNIVTEDDGLYEINGEYIFRGSKVNNYLEFADQLWYIVKVDKDNHIKIVQIDNKTRHIWDYRYNVDRNAKVGVNDFNKSSMESYLLELFNDEKFIEEDLKGLIVHKSWCVGKRTDSETNKTGEVECSVVTEPAPLGLIQANDFLMASLDENCTTTLSPSCQNYNYLASSDYTWWTITAAADNTHRAYKVSGGYLMQSSLTSNTRTHVALFLSENVAYAGGTGTYDDPYIVR